MHTSGLPWSEPTLFSHSSGQFLPVKPMESPSSPPCLRKVILTHRVRLCSVITSPKESSRCIHITRPPGWIRSSQWYYCSLFSYHGTYTFMCYSLLLDWTPWAQELSKSISCALNLAQYLAYSGIQLVFVERKNWWKKFQQKVRCQIIIHTHKHTDDIQSS